MNKTYQEYMSKWTEGLYDEINFWKCYMEAERGNSSLKMLESSERMFEFEKDLPLDSMREGEDYYLADIGSGPFFRCGAKTDKVNLHVTAIDPLALPYKTLKKEYDFESNVKLQTGFVELLDFYFKENSFDMVHMRNSLDHCFDAVFAIWELLYICKVGGKIILRHFENEAEREQYRGLHQWNLSLHNTENSFIIWRDDYRVDVCDMFDAYADIKLYPDEKEDGWTYNKVVMIKKKNVTIPDNEYLKKMSTVVYDFLTKVLLEDVWLKKGNEIEVQRKLIRNIISNQNIDEAKAVIEKYQIESVIIYGFGAVGKALLELMQKINIPVSDIIDRQDIEYDEKSTIRIEEFISTDNRRGKIIVTVPQEYEVIEKNLTDLGIEKNRILCVKKMFADFLI